MTIFIKNKIIMSERLGYVFNTFENGKYNVIEYTSANNIVVQFEDGTKRKTTWANAKNHYVRNPNVATLSGIKIIVSEKYDKNHKFYDIWKRMITRCYHEKTKINKPCYDDVFVCDEWYNFQNFAEWCELNFKAGYELDKDILTNEKYYGPNTCCFIPHEINTFISYKIESNGLPKGVCFDKSRNNYQARCNVDGKYLGKRFDTPEEAFLWYKQTKEDAIKNIANKWKNFIDIKVFERLITYEIN